MIAPAHLPVDKDRFQVLIVGECCDPKQVNSANAHAMPPRIECLELCIILGLRCPVLKRQAGPVNRQHLLTLDGGSSQSKNRPDSVKWPVE